MWAWSGVAGGILLLIFFMLRADRPLPQVSQNLPLPSPSRPTPANPHAEATNPIPSKWHHYALGQRNAKALAFQGKYLWIGTSKGIIRYDTTTADQSVVYGARNGLLSDGIFSITIDKEGNTWVGTYGGGLSKFDGERWINYNVPDGLADAFVYDLLFTENGTIWIATWSGANKVEGDISQRSSWTTYTVKNTNGGLPNDWVYGLDIDEKGDIWFATEGGLAFFDGKVWKNWDHKDGLGAPYEEVKQANPFGEDVGKASVHHSRQKIEQGLTDVTTAYNPNYIVSMIRDRQGRVWCGTWGAGLSRFDGERFTTYTTKDGLPGNFILSLAEGPDGSIWIGTNQGLARFDGTAFKTYTRQDGLFGDDIFSIVFRGKEIWLGSWGGVSQVFNGLPQ